LEGASASPGCNARERVRIERHSSVVEEDLPGIFAQIARDNPVAAERVLDAVERTFEEIAAHPECGVVYPTQNPAMIGIRMLPMNSFSNYLVYRCKDAAVRILYVVHDARHLPRLFRSEART
jgi:toxin ParE1/3/4